MLYLSLEIDVANPKEQVKFKLLETQLPSCVKVIILGLMFLGLFLDNLCFNAFTLKWTDYGGHRGNLFWSYTMC